MFSKCKKKLENFLRMFIFLILSSFFAFSINSVGRIAIPLHQLQPEIFSSGEQASHNFQIIGKQLFANTKKGLWIISGDGKQVKMIEVNTEFSGYRELDRYKPILVDNQIFLESPYGIWIVNSETNKAIKISEVDSIVSQISKVKAYKDQLIIGTNQGEILVIGKDGKLRKRLTIGNETIVDFEMFNQTIYVMTDNIQFNFSSIDENAYFAKKISEIESVQKILPVDDWLLISSAKGLSLINNKGVLVKKLEEIKSLGDAKSLDRSLFLTTLQGLWVISLNEMEVKQVKGVEKPTCIEIFEESLFFGGNNGGLFKVGKDGVRVEQVNIMNDLAVCPTVVMGNKLILDLFDGISAINSDLKHIDNFHAFDTNGINSIGEADGHIYIQSLGVPYKIYPKIKISTYPVVENWWIKTIRLIFPNVMPSQDTKMQAVYIDENDEDSLDRNVLREFRFAKADGDSIPSDDKFAPADQFNYKIDLGKNTIHFWVKDKWGNAFEQKTYYFGIPPFSFIVITPFIFSVFFVLVCFTFAPKVAFCHSAIMNPWLRKYFSLGSIPLLLSVFSSLRRYILRRYGNSVSKDKEFDHWKTQFVSPSEEFLPENFGKKLNDERKLLLNGQSGIGKTVFFKHLTACYTSQNKPPLPAKVFPVYISLTNFGGISVEELIYNQLFSYGKITDKELAPMFLEQGGLLIFLDGVNEVQNVADRQKLSEFVEKYWKSNFICLSSQQSYPEIESIPKVELKTFGKAKVDEFIRQKVENKEKAEKAIESLTNEDYQLYSVPRDLEFAVEILNKGNESLPKSRTELYKTIFNLIFTKWRENGREDAEDFLCEHAYMMIATRNLTFDTVENPNFGQITTDLFEQKFLIKREKSYNFRHDLIRAFLASEYFYPRWKNLFENIKGKVIDSNWLEMLKFSCENIEESNEIKSLVFEVLNKSIRKDIVKNLVIWIKANNPNKCESWGNEFYAKYGELDFKLNTEENKIMEKPKKIMFVMANPSDTTKLRLDEEFREVKNGLRLANLRDGFDLEVSTATRPNDLRRDLLQYSPDFVHFSGHGETEGIVLEDENGNAKIVETESLADLFSLFSDITECVVLNSCFSENQAKAIRKHIPFVIGMNKAVPDAAAIEFAIGFYDAIGAGRNVEDAFKFGKNAIDLNSIDGKDIPVLMKK